MVPSATLLCQGCCKLSGKMSRNITPEDLHLSCFVCADGKKRCSVVWALLLSADCLQDTTFKEHPIRELQFVVLFPTAVAEFFKV